MPDLPNINTQKGRILNSVLTGVRARAHLRIAANVADAETVTIGNDVYEFDVIQTDTGINTSGGEWNNTTDPITVTMASHGLSVGAILLVESEFFRVEAVVDADSVTVSRGYGGSTPATHADANDIYESAAGVTAGNIPVPLAATLTPAVATDALIAIINTYGNEPISAIELGDNDVLLVGDVACVNTTALAEDMAGAGNVVDSAMAGGVVPNGDNARTFAIVPSANEVAADVICLPMDFTPTGALVQIRVTATGAALAWDGKVTIDGTNNLLKIDNSGTTDWAATHTLSVLVF